MCVCELSCRWTVFKCVSVNCLVGELSWFILVDVSIYRIWKQIYYKKSKIKVDQRDKIWCIHLFVRSFWISIMARTVSAKLCGQMWAWTHNLPQTYVRNSPPIGLKPNKHLRKFLQTFLHVPSLHVHVGLIYLLSIFLLITWLIRRLTRAFYACTNTHNPVNICKRATFGPLAKRHTNGALLVGRWWPDPMAFR